MQKFFSALRLLQVQAR